MRGEHRANSPWTQAAIRYTRAVAQSLRTRMKTRRLTSLSRRTMLTGLTTLPVFLARAMAQESPTPAQVFSRPAARPTSAGQVLNVMDFEALARDALAPAHFGYIATGADDDRTVVRNHEAFSDYEIRARRFNDLRQLTTALSVFGTPWPSPLYTSAVSSMRAFHPEAEIAVARAANSRSAHFMLSTGASSAMKRRCAPRSTVCPKWSRRRVAASRCSSTAAFDAARTSSRRWRSGRLPLASADRRPGVSRRLVSPAWKPSSTSSTPN